MITLIGACNVMLCPIHVFVSSCLHVFRLMAYYRTNPTIKDYADDIDVLTGYLAATVAALAVALAPAVAGAPADDADAGKGGLKKYYALAIRAALAGAPPELSKPAFGVAMKALDDHRSEPLGPAMLDRLIRAKYVTMKGEQVASVRAKEFVAFVTHAYWAGEGRGEADDAAGGAGGAVIATTHKAGKETND